MDAWPEIQFSDWQILLTLICISSMLMFFIWLTIHYNLIYLEYGWGVMGALWLTGIVLFCYNFILVPAGSENALRIEAQRRINGRKHIKHQELLRQEDEIYKVRRAERLKELEEEIQKIKNEK